MLNGNLRRSLLSRGLAAALLVALAAPVAPVAAQPTARGPESVADLAESLLDAVVNISTSQKSATERSVAPVPTPKAMP